MQVKRNVNSKSTLDNRYPLNNEFILIYCHVSVKSFTVQLKNSYD
jgi:hypothetical protein